jgi:hypothetical protein
MKIKRSKKKTGIPIYIIGVFALIVVLSCNSQILSTPINNTPTLQVTLTTNKISDTSTPGIATSIPTGTSTPTPAFTPTPSPMNTIESLKAMVTADLLSCRYGPGSEYLFLYGLRKGANIKLIGRTEGNNWVYVEGKNRCWVNKEYISIAEDMNSLPIVYPGIAKLPISPYYPPTTVLKVTRIKNVVTVKWLDIPLRAGDEEDASMQHYIIEVWRCQGGTVIFDPLATNDVTITFTDEPGCSEPSHGRIFVQEKHGFAGPAEIPWPPFP